MQSVARVYTCINEVDNSTDFLRIPVYEGPVTVVHASVLRSHACVHVAERYPNRSKRPLEYDPRPVHNNNHGPPGNQGWAGLSRIYRKGLEQRRVEIQARAKAAVPAERRVAPLLDGARADKPPERAITNKHRNSTRMCPEFS